MAIDKNIQSTWLVKGTQGIWGPTKKVRTVGNRCPEGVGRRVLSKCNKKYNKELWWNYLNCVSLMHSRDVHITTGFMINTWKLCGIVSKQYDVLTYFIIDWCLFHAKLLILDEACIISQHCKTAQYILFKLQLSDRMHILVLQQRTKNLINQKQRPSRTQTLSEQLWMTLLLLRITRDISA